MARIRTVKPGFFRSLTITGLSKPTRLTFIGLWTYVDDEGRGVDDARLLKAELWPLDDDYTARKVEADLDHLAKAGLIHRYESGGRRYLVVTAWREHQRINRPQPSTLPVPAPFTERAVNAHGSVPGHSLPEGNGSGMEGNGMEESSSSNALGNRGRAIATTTDDLAATLARRSREALA